jgi:hypothetical protein
MLAKADTDATRLLHSVIDNAIQAYIESRPKPVVVEEPAPSDTKEQDHTIFDPLALLKCMVRKPKRAKRAHRDTSSRMPLSQRVKSVVDLFARRPRPPDEYSPAELIDLISLVARVGGLTPDFYSVYHVFLQENMRGLLRVIGAAVGERETGLARELAHLGRAGQVSLIRELCPMAVQTDTILKIHAATEAAASGDLSKQKKK